MHDAVVHLFPQGWHGDEGYRSNDDRSTASKIDECDGS